eukprot:TRINITY_DN51577_c0_g1_i2.p1 TRINITY_DN51577_c0_g1~~TRINITY_DN51577_c0_g1_i2.p1  ORF type:complete len:474 (+),score=49.37 TRINITY_DN51577_c0_g1_i2:94-1515(+)
MPTPKRPTSAFFYFQNSKRAAFRQIHPELQNCELSKKLAESWKSLTDAEKEPFCQMHETDQHRYKMECHHLGLSPPFHKKRSRNQMGHVSVQQPGGLPHVVQLADGLRKDMLAPKVFKARRPTPAFIYFQNNHREALRDASPDLSHCDISKKLGLVWRQLALEQKKPYLDMHEADRDRYMKERDTLDSVMMGQVQVMLPKRQKTESNKGKMARAGAECLVNKDALELALATALPPPSQTHAAPAEPRGYLNSLAPAQMAISVPVSSEVLHHLQQQQQLGPSDVVQHLAHTASQHVAHAANQHLVHQQLPHDAQQVQQQLPHFHFQHPQYQQLDQHQYENQQFQHQCLQFEHQPHMLPQGQPGMLAPLGTHHTGPGLDSQPQMQQQPMQHVPLGMQLHSDVNNTHVLSAPPQHIAEAPASAEHAYMPESASVLGSQTLKDVGVHVDSQHQTPAQMPASVGHLSGLHGSEYAYDS